MRMGCANCGCVVEGGVRVVVCHRPDCCCGHLPVHAEATEEGEGS